MRDAVQTEDNMSVTVQTEDNMSVTPQTEYNTKYKLRIIMTANSYKLKII